MTIRPVRNNYSKLNNNPLISVAKMDTDINNRAWLDILQNELTTQYKTFQNKKSVEQLLEMRDIISTIINVLDPTLNDQWQESQVDTYGDYSDRCVAIIPDIPPMTAQEQVQESDSSEASAPVTNAVTSD